MTKKVAFNKRIDLHYSIENPSGMVFESTFDKNPIKFKIGDGTIPQKLEITLYGLKEKDKQEITLDPKDAFGIRDEKKTIVISKNQFPDQKMIEVNNVIEVDTKENNGKLDTSFAIIKDVRDNDVLLDLNHPLADVTVKFTAEIVKIYDE
tara:strand:- start:592 stop:1041 length:450 start_codon:yes stop_codon:yes gene_type:complete